MNPEREFPHGLRKVDADEPWRYRCPECDSVQVEPLVADEKIPGKGYGFLKKDLISEHEKHNYSCRECEWRGVKVYDAKVDGTVIR